MTYIFNVVCAKSSSLLKIYKGMTPTNYNANRSGYCLARRIFGVFVLRASDRKTNHLSTLRYC